MAFNRQSKEPLSVTNPNLVKEWDFDKNAPLTLDNISGVNKKYWWICERGHRWEALLSNRIKGSGCPYCSGHKAIQGINDLTTTNPELINEWNYERNNPLLPNNVLAGSEKKVWWKCSKGHEWESLISNRTKGQMCPFCSGKRIIPGETDLESVNPDLAKEWNYEKNKPLLPSQVFPNSNKKAWWKCSNGHEWQAVIGSRHSGRGCPYCNGKLAITGKNDLATLRKELLNEWDYSKNTGIDPRKITLSSDRKAWWICPKGHSYDVAIKYRTRGEGCPYCSGKRVLIGFNDLAFVRPDLAEEWNYEKNSDLTPYMFTAGSGKKVWWKCWRGHEWLSSIANRNKGRECPVCSGTGSSMPEQGIAFYLVQCCEIEQRAKINGQEADIFIPKYKVGIEYDGRYYHANRGKEDKAKNEKLEDAGVLLFRVKESDDNRIVNNDIYFKADNMGSNYEWALRELFSLLAGVSKNESFTSIKVDINRDYISIRERFRLLETENSVANKYPELIKEWNYEKNSGLTPEMFSAGSREKVWWRCQKGHEWQTGIVGRTLGTGCPYCSNRKLLVGFNDLATTNPEVAKEWNYEKNAPVLPTQVFLGSPKRFWWKCSNGHEWSSTVLNRKDGNGCPYCSGRYAISGINDLLTLDPKFVKEWNYERNAISPALIKLGSGQKVWWKCEKGHEWQATVLDRNQGSGCPYCANRKVLVGYNDLETTNPDLVKEWDYEKNYPLTPKDVTVGSSKKVWWKCKYGHECLSSIHNRNIRGGCPFCGRLNGGKKHTATLIQRNGSLSDLNPKLAKEWHPTKNGVLTPAEVTANTSKKVWWICEKGHEWKTSVSNRARGNGCPICSNQQVLKGYNDLETTDPELAREWDYDKNAPFTPDQISAGSNKKVWWRCSNEHSWESTPANRSAGKGCPYCSGKRVTVGKNDLLTQYPEIARELHPIKNGDLKPTDVTQKSNKKVWWMCSKGHEWQAAIANRTGRNKTGCPYCSNKIIKEVLCIETGEVYQSITEAFEKTGINNIGACCRGSRKNAGGYHWKYIEV